MEKPFVSVACAAFNHAKYIRRAIEGFLMQKCDFPFEIIIHDDASTDGTADIVREYAEKYPDRITAILQTENQYSKGKKLLDLMYPRARGKYIAICEGDDYWTDPLKLQKQADALEAHPEIDICATGSALESGGKIIGKCAPADKDTVFTPEEVILGGGDFVSTCSLMIRRDRFMSMPAFRRIISYDYVTQINGALRGGMLYLCDCTCVYRVMTEGSWTVSYFSDGAKRKMMHDKTKLMLEQLDRDTEGRYSKAINYKIKELDYYYLNNNGHFREMLSCEYREVVKNQPLRNRVKLYLRCLFPSLVKKRREQKIEKAKNNK